MCQACYSNGKLVGELSDFEPIDGLQASGGDLYLVSLSANDVLYSKETLDPWYQATRLAANFSFPDNPDMKFDVYTSDEAGSPLACVATYQYCFPSAGSDHRCIDLVGAADAVNDAKALISDNKAAQRRFDWFLMSAGTD